MGSLANRAAMLFATTPPSRMEPELASMKSSDDLFFYGPMGQSVSVRDFTAQIAMFVFLVSPL